MSEELKNHKKGVLEVSAIENGTVIDHIPPTSLFKVIKLLGLDRTTHQVTFGTNLQSKRIGRKAIIKIADKDCGDEEIGYISLVAPLARINIIRDFEVAEKREVEVPTHVEGFVKCGNPMCVTNRERCKYCEKITAQEQIEIIR